MWIRCMHVAFLDGLAYHTWRAFILEGEPGASRDARITSTLRRISKVAGSHPRSMQPAFQICLLFASTCRVVGEVQRCSGEAHLVVCAGCMTLRIAQCIRGFEFEGFEGFE